MVFEQLFKAKWIENKSVASFYLGILTTIIGFISASLIFQNTPHLIGITTIFFIVMIAIPGVNKLLEIEENIEAKEKQSFFKEHEAIIDFFVYFFLGIFCVLLLISLFSPSSVFTKENLLGIKKQTTIQIKGLPPPPTESSTILTIIKNNLFVMVILFLLSFFYSSGALFIIVLNASIFASSFTEAIRTSLPGNALDAFVFTMCNLGTKFLHTMPEVLSYFLVAIAGGVLSKAVTREKLFSKRFFKVVKDALILLGFSFIILLIAALIESNISLSFNICSNKLILTTGMFVMLGIISFELWRKEKILKKKK